MLTAQQLLEEALDNLAGLVGQTFDVLTIAKPPDLPYAIHLVKTLSKLSGLIGNMIEFSIASRLNQHHWGVEGQWLRQDPAFPDLIFSNTALSAIPGIEVKTWFPFATEMTARYKESALLVAEKPIEVVIIAWIPEHLIYGRPKIVAIWHENAFALAQQRDLHYHQPPDYLVFEPLDTRHRTSNLQQSTASGYKFQGTIDQYHQAHAMTQRLGITNYSSAIEYQAVIKKLQSSFPYRLDTNFAKLDRIQHKGLEAFKREVLALPINGFTLSEWGKLLTNETAIARLLNE